MRGDRILAIEGIVFDKQTLDTLNQNMQLTEDSYRSVSVTVTTYYEIITNLLEAWVKNEWPTHSDSYRRPTLHLTIARCTSTAESVTPVPESDYMPTLVTSQNNRSKSLEFQVI